MVSADKIVAREQGYDASLDAAAMQRDLATLCSDRFAGRRVGTLGHDLARDWLVGQLQQQAGLQTRVVEFPVHPGVLDLFAPPFLKVAAGGARSDRPGTEAALKLEHRVEFAEHPRSADSAGMVTGVAHRLREDNIAPGSWAILEAIPRGHEFHALAIRAAAAGVLGLLVPQYPGSEGFLTKRIMVQETVDLPVLAVRADLLSGLEGKLIAASVPQRVGVPTGANIVALLSGTDPAQEDRPLIVSAHYDGVGDDPGGHRLPAASDNAAGVAIMLQLASIFGRAQARPRRSIIFAALDAEEVGALGSRAHVRQLKESGQQPLVLNIDGAGRLNGPIWVDPGTDLGATREVLLQALDQAGRALGLPLIVASVASDNRRYAGAGFAAIGISSGGYGYHTPADRLDQIEPEAVTSVGKLVLETIIQLAF